MRHARDMNNERRFTRQDWINQNQIKGFFSSHAAAKRHQKPTRKHVDLEELSIKTYWHK